MVHSMSGRLPKMVLLGMGKDGAPNYAVVVTAGSYVGTASLVDQLDGLHSDVTVTLARADAEGTRWFGSVQGLADLERDGHDVVIELPNGARGKGRLEIDLTGDVARVRIVGAGPAPI